VENKVTVSAFARRRLAVVMTRLKMAETVSDVSVRGREGEDAERPRAVFERSDKAPQATSPKDSSRVRRRPGEILRLRLFMAVIGRPRVRVFAFIECASASVTAFRLSGRSGSDSQYLSSEARLFSRTG